MDFKLVQKYQQCLVDEFESIRRDPNTVKLWNKASVIRRLHNVYSDFIATEASRIQGPAHTDADDPGLPPKRAPEVNMPPSKVFVPEWQPEVEGYQGDLGDDD